MSEKTDLEFIEVWMDSLAKSARGLDLNDADDRASFRGLVQHSMRNLTWDGMRRIAQYLGADKVGRSRDAAWRTITTLYIQKHAPAQAPAHAKKRSPRPIKWQGLKSPPDYDILTKRPSGTWDIMDSQREGWVIKPPWYWKTL